MYDLTSVSYTHLDVYKRQLLRGALQHGVLKASDTHILVRREEQCKEITQIFSNTPIKEEVVT